MSNLLYLGIAVVLSAGGIGVLWARNRRPTSLESSIEDFRRELRALSPPTGRDADRSGKDGHAG
ncbi:MAG: hypothetical protein ACR2H3_05365 [Acidimicrobiales bacterium]